MSNNIHQMSAPGGPQMNKYEQLSSCGHQMPLAGGSKYSEVPCPECTSAGAKGGGGGGEEVSVWSVYKFTRKKYLNIGNIFRLQV